MPATVTSSREDEARRDAPEVCRIGEEPLEVGGADEDHPVAERRRPVERQTQRVERRPEEEDDRDGELRRHERVGQPAIARRRCVSSAGAADYL